MNDIEKYFWNQMKNLWVCTLEESPKIFCKMNYDNSQFLLDIGNYHKALSCFMCYDVVEKNGNKLMEIIKTSYGYYIRYKCEDNGDNLFIKIDPIWISDCIFSQTIS